MREPSETAGAASLLLVQNTDLSFLFFFQSLQSKSYAPQKVGVRLFPTTFVCVFFFSVLPAVGLISGFDNSLKQLAVT